MQGLEYRILEGSEYSVLAGFEYGRCVSKTWVDMTSSPDLSVSVCIDCYATNLVLTYAVFPDGSIHGLTVDSLTFKSEKSILRHLQATLREESKNLPLDVSLFPYMFVELTLDTLTFEG